MDTRVGGTPGVVRMVAGQRQQNDPGIPLWNLAGPGPRSPIGMPQAPAFPSTLNSYLGLAVARVGFYGDGTAEVGELLVLCASRMLIVPDHEKACAVPLCTTGGG